MIELRGTLSSERFYNGAKPDKADFEFLFNSFFHKSEDGLTVEDFEPTPGTSASYLNFASGIRIGPLPDEGGSAGLMRFEGGRLQVHDGAEYQNLIIDAEGISGGFSTLENSESIGFFNLGRVGIGGPEDPAPTYKLDVNIGLQPETTNEDPNPAANPDNQIRIGQLIISLGREGGLYRNAACLSHQSFANDTNFAIVHTNSGRLVLNSNGTDADDSQIRFNIGNSRAMTLDSAGRLGIGENNPESLLHVDGDIRVEDTVVHTSDKRLKKNITPLRDSLNKVLKLVGVSFQKADQKNSRDEDVQPHLLGLVAQDVEAVLPEIVNTDAKGYKYMNYIGLIPVLIESVKELHQQNEVLRAKLEQL